MNAGVPPLIPGRRVSPRADLLSRDEVVLSRAAAAQVVGARVLVTGAAGSVGVALARRLAAVHPARVWLLDHDGAALETHAAEAAGAGAAGTRFPGGDDLIVLDVRDARAVVDVVRSLAPDVVIHAAALTDGAQLELAPCDAVRTNVLGTRNVVRAASDAGVDLFVHVSTDEAGSTSSVLGLSARLAELVVAGHGQGADGMRTMSVRVGPLLDGPRGLFQALAWHGLSGLPVALSHAEATCPIMTAGDAAALVLEAAALRGAPRTYVLDPGDHVHVVEFARYLAVRVGLPEPEFRYARDVPDRTAGGAADRPAARRTSHPRVWSLPPDVADPSLDARLDGLSSLVGHLGPAGLRGALAATVHACAAAELARHG